MPQRLISDDGSVRVWEHADAGGKVIGSWAGQRSGMPR